MTTGIPLNDTTAVDDFAYDLYDEESMWYMSGFLLFAVFLVFVIILFARQCRVTKNVSTTTNTSNRNVYVNSGAAYPSNLVIDSPSNLVIDSPSNLVIDSPPRYEDCGHHPLDVLPQYSDLFAINGSVLAPSADSRV